MAGQDKISIASCNDEDMSDCFTVISKGFEHDAPFVDAYFPDHDTEEGRRKHTKRLLGWKHSSPNMIMLKAVIKSDSTNEEKIIGFAIWTYMTEAPPKNLDDAEDVRAIWPQEQHAEYMRRMWTKYVIPRTRAVEESNGAGAYVLEMLSVDKAYHLRGAGSALIKVGTDLADEKGLISVVEATMAGKPAYEKSGFYTEIERMDLSAGEGFEERREPQLIFMKRNPR